MRLTQRPRRAGSIVLAALVAALLAAHASASLNAPPPGKKVTICHHTEGKSGTHEVTIQVGAPAAPAHLRNHPLDTVGPCPTPPGPNTPAKKAVPSNSPGAPAAEAPVQTTPATTPDAPAPETDASGESTPDTHPGNGNANGSDKGGKSDNGNGADPPHGKK